MKSSGKRSRLRLTAWFSTRVSTLYNTAKSLSSITCCPLIILIKGCISIVSGKSSQFATSFPASNSLLLLFSAIALFHYCFGKDTNYFPFLQTFRRLFAELSCASPRRRRVLPRVRPPHCRMLNRSTSVSPAVIHFSFFPTIMFHIITRNSDQSNICITLSIIIFSGFPSEILNPR